MLLSDATWLQRSGSTLAQVMAWCLIAPSHYLNQSWPLMNEVLWHLPKNNFKAHTQDIFCKMNLEIIILKITFISNRRQWVNTLRPRQNGCHFADDTFKRIFVYENVKILIEISLKFVPKGPINNIPALVQIMAWRRPGNKPLSQPMLVCLPTHICVTRLNELSVYCMH